MVSTPTTTRPSFWELHLSSRPGFPKQHGKRVKRLGGHYNACRGDSETRYVTVPRTAEGDALANGLLQSYAKGGEGASPCVLKPAGYVGCPSWVIVHHGSSVEQLERKLARATRQAVARGILTEDKAAQLLSRPTAQEGDVST
jgi:hypothetical protein